MAYTALEQQRIANQARFGSDAGPEQPGLFQTENKFDLASSALRFIHNRCEGLRFSPEKAAREADEGIYLGASIAQGQIPYNMQMDVDRLCLERELERFIASGTADDAYTIYYCYLKMFLGRYGDSKKMVELLSEYEQNGSSLLMKHRDHYSHSVYVFALGLAIYETNAAYRSAFATAYGFEDPEGSPAACAFLEYWGLTALFHDIGYPFELPFEQVVSYFEADGAKRGPGSVFIAYKDVSPLIALDGDAQAHLEGLYGRSFAHVAELLAYNITARLGSAYGFDEGYLLDILTRKPTSPEEFGYFMDHAWFSAMRLYQELSETIGPDAIGVPQIDALSAIILHNSLFKFSISFYKDPARRKDPLAMEVFPLAYLLMLCDELQCWDRTAYGRNSRTELHPMAASFDFSNGGIDATYYYDQAEQEKIARFEGEFRAWQLAHKRDGNAKPPRLKAYSDMAGGARSFTGDIERIVDTSKITLSVQPALRPADRSSKHTYLSSSNFLHLYDFAVALNGRYSYQGAEDEVSTEQLEAEFEGLSLEYQLSNINQAKSFGKYLNALRCFYTDRPVDFDMLTAFTADQTAVFAPMEHERWVREKAAMAWTSGDAYETVPRAEGETSKQLRERFRMHKLAMAGAPTEGEVFEHYEGLSEADKGKDWLPFNSMLELIKKFDGLRIYKLDA